MGVALALDYVHNKSAQPVIHRDVKSSNILLSDDFEPQVLYSLICVGKILLIIIFMVFWLFHQLSDFGLAKWASTTASHITCTDVAGTFGFVTILTI